MKKRVACILLTILSLNVFGLSVPGVYAAMEPDIRITVDNVPVVSDTEPFIEYGRTYVPVRAVLEAYGVDSVEWEAPYVIVKDGLTTLRIPILESHIEKNGDWILTDAPALVKNGRTCLPIRAAVEALGGRVTWEVDTRTVVITRPTQEISLRDGSMRVVRSGLQGVRSADYNRSGELALITYGDRRIGTWNSTERVFRHIDGLEEAGIIQARFSSDGNTISTLDEEGTIKSWYGSTGMLLSQDTLNYPEGFYPIEDISKDGNIVISSISSNELAVYSIETGGIIYRYPMQVNDPLSVRLSPDAEKFMVISEGKCSVLNTATGAVETVFGSDVLESRFSPNGNQVLTVSYGNVVTTWDAGSGERQSETTLGSGYATAVEFSPDGKYAAVVFGKTAYLLDSLTLKVMHTMAGHASDIKNICFDSKGAMIATASSDGTARIWSTGTGESLAQLLGHAGNVESVAFSPDGKSLLTTSGDGTVRIWALDYYVKQLKPAVEKSLATGPQSIGIVSGVGGFNDSSFNESALRGLREAEKKYGMTVYPLESANEANYVLNLDTASNQKKALICAVGFMMGDALKSVAESYPEQRYAILDNSYGNETLPNITGITFKMNEASFLVGYIAGKMTKTNKVGFVGGVDFSLIREFEYGYQAGIKMANPNCELISAYAGSFTDAAAGKEIAANMYGQGADIIYHASGATGNGIIESAKEKGLYVIGAEIDQSVLAPDNVLTSAIKRLDTAMLNVVGDLKSGKLQGGTTLTYGLAEGGVDIAPSSSRLVPQSILTEIEGMRKRIINGEIVVPSTLEEYETFVNSIPH